MKKLTSITALLALFSFTSQADIQYVDAKIQRVEVCDAGGGTITAYLSEVSGTTPSTSNGCSNDQVLPFVRIATSQAEFESKAIMVSVALTAFSTDSTVRIRYDDSQSNKVNSLTINK
ncbi:hypothetical protein EYS14_00595 [Alteromonadaceae bacterium M269]|nr:hypothetical protein EYS14_00595 [Alteromonadaceae bacterium M269]